MGSDALPAESMREWLASQGYRYYGPSAGKRDALLYQKRRYELEADTDSNAKCCINVWEWPGVDWGAYGMDYRADLSGMNQFNYEVEMYWETDEPNSYSVILQLYTFKEEALREQLGELETLCVSLWNTYSKGRKH